jgi:hypothetical protein
MPKRDLSDRPERNRDGAAHVLALVPDVELIGPSALMSEGGD